MSDRADILAGAKRRAFTLIEILVIITILGLLISIAVPAGIMFRRQAARKASLARITLLSGACEMYRSDFGFYPPSEAAFHPNLPNPASTEDRWTGGQLLCFLLTGYAPDLPRSGEPDRDGTPASSDYGFWEDDGKESFGFRIAPKGRVYGPYGGAEGVPAERFEADDGSLGPPVFVDTFDEPICYYRYYDEENPYDPYDITPDNVNTYYTSHNQMNAPAYHGPANIVQYASTPGGTFYRRDFILCSKGPNDTWYEPWVDGDDSGRDDENDDITNFAE